MKATSKNDRSHRTSGGNVVINVTDKDYRKEVADGVQKEHALKPGRHLFRRGGFKARHPDFTGAKKTPVKVRVNSSRRAVGKTVKKQVSRKRNQTVKRA